MKEFLLTLLTFFLLLHVSAQDAEVIHYKELQKVIPANLAGFTGDGAPDGKTMSMNGMSFSTAERTYKKGSHKLNITMVDYHGAATLYNSAAMAWSMNMQFEDDDSKVEGFSEGDFSGIIEIHKKNRKPGW
ncbi:hypothetical protein FNH22_21240 [Fulvivirga sp. M361]|uniref:hypothetical protein n=1 Tax=Fulvivirga sp. M361 TaxID=2594266 RepID=UPI001179E09C|nr:hypothetical protein [Fulvivirga sp. M361]TRX53038.1 hypothetical protein FNH22_21240 [Fulvivirga sp. M361]